MAYSVCSRASNHNRVKAIVRRLRFTILRAGDQEGILEKPLSSQSSCLTGDWSSLHAAAYGRGPSHEWAAGLI